MTSALALERMERAMRAPWSYGELVEKVRHARQVRPEPLGGLLGASPLNTLASTYCAT